jgi:NAD(P)-dependent dehydrogenase (short-subunit alcohol dehydrogenase family)
MSSSPAAAKRLDNAVEEIDMNITGVQGDAGNLADLDRLFETVKKEKGHINILFSSAVFYKS